MSVLKLTSQNFEEEVLKSDKTVLIDFYADWCGPCRMMGPIVEEIANTAGENVKVGKVNVDDNQELAVKFGIMSIPTLIIFKNGKPVESLIGVRDKAEIMGKLK